MTRIGITGHQSIPAVAHAPICDSLQDAISSADPAEPLWGVTSLAAGADQLFAELIVRTGGRLHVVIPALQYDQAFQLEGLQQYRALLAEADKVERLDFNEATEKAFFAAGKRVVDACDTLLAVWDGRPSRGFGGTADVVEYARSVGRNLEIIWPPGVER